MTAPVRLQLSRRKGFDLQALSLVTNGLPAQGVARPGPWGNPFVVGRNGTQDDCVRLYRVLLSGHVAMITAPHPNFQQVARVFVAEHIDELKNKNLACWCRAGMPCHADVLLELANAPEAGRAPSSVPTNPSPLEPEND